MPEHQNLSGWPISVDWADDDWDVAIKFAHRLTKQQVSGAIARLKELFPLEQIAGLRAAHHPLAQMQKVLRTRVLLLEFGHALASTELSSLDRKRCYQATEFLSLLSEMRIWLALSQSGFAVSRPSTEQNKLSCDFILAQHNGVPLAIEVKLPTVGQAQLANDRRELAFYFALTTQIVFPAGVCGVATISLHHLPNDIEAAAGEARRRVLLGRWNGDLDRLELGEWGHLVLRKLPERNDVTIDMDVCAFDGKAEARRIQRSSLNKGHRQIRESEMPGVLVVDLSLNRTASGVASYLRNWAIDAEGLAAVVVVEPDIRGDHYFHHIEILPGPKVDLAHSFLVALTAGCLTGAHCSAVGSCPCAT